MGKLDSIKAKLAKLLIEVEMSVLKTDKGVLTYEGEEIAEGVLVYVEDEEGQRTPAADGDYVLEDGRTITVAEGKVTSIVEKKEEEAPEEPTEEEPAPAEDVKAEEEPAPAEEPAEETPVEEEPKEDEKDAIAELTKRVEELEKMVEELVAAMEGFKAETLSKLNMAAAKPATEEFEQIAKPKITGDSRVDKLINGWNK